MSGKKKLLPVARKRILILDDHPMMREGLAQLIGNEADLSVCGEAENANEAIEKINDLKPDLVLADITLPGKMVWNSSKTFERLYLDWLCSSFPCTTNRFTPSACCGPAAADTS